MSSKDNQNNTYQSILVIVIGFAFLSLILKIKLLLTIGLLLGIISVFSDSAARVINNVWIKFAELLGNINSKILISVVFYIFLFPVSLLYKIKNKDVLKLKKPKGVQSNYADRNHQYEPRDFDNLW